MNTYLSRLLEEDIQAALSNRKVLFLLGARQVGKTTIIKHILKMCPGRLLNMDMEIDRSRLKEAAQLAPAEGVRVLTDGELLVIDEAQRVPDIGQITKGWYDADMSTKIILLGSSTATLLDHAASELVGRNEKLWLTPLLFREVLAGQQWFRPDQAPSSISNYFGRQVQALLMQRLVFGSYPEAYLADDPREYLENLIGDYLLKDIFTKSLVRSPDDVRRLLAELAQEIGNTISVAQLATRLKLSRQTVQRYLDLLEGIFVIFSLPAYATDPIKEVNKSNKYYFWDTGVKNALQREWTVSSNRSDIDALWENWVIAEVMKLSRTLRRHEDLFFWRTRHNSNVELLVKQGEALHPFNIAFEPDGAAASRSFESAYGVKPQIIHPGNVLEILL